ncbi:response regulator [Labilibaculum sp. DW002]|uniref:Response regulator n=1 Tax=Paralabilibaculum antarcticum TaxID=2912572 RepID=A0ABT5VUK5_9BACT|nr:response regulator [Labilibaculum sp. DW002]MDE5419104.1 response regulator [Labilibaculum sp. DW002]
MSKVKILIVEDELLVAMNMADLLEDLGYEVLEPQINYEGAVECLMNDKPDIALLDIQIEGLKNGVDVARFITENSNIPFIFLTSLADPRTVEQAKIVKPNAYLVKPFNQDDLYTSIELALYNFQASKQEEILSEPPLVKIHDSFFVKSNDLFHKVKYSDIVYIKSDHVYVELHTVNKKRHVLRSSMLGVLADLPQNFVRIHRSYSINIDFIESLNLGMVIVDGCKIPVGKSYAEQLIKMITIK